MCIGGAKVFRLLSLKSFRPSLGSFSFSLCRYSTARCSSGGSCRYGYLMIWFIPFHRCAHILLHSYCVSCTRLTAYISNFTLAIGDFLFVILAIAVYNGMCLLQPHLQPNLWHWNSENFAVAFTLCKKSFHELWRKAALFCAETSRLNTINLATIWG